MNYKTEFCFCSYNIDEQTNQEKKQEEEAQGELGLDEMTEEEMKVAQFASVQLLNLGKYNFLSTLTRSLLRGFSRHYHLVLSRENKIKAFKNMIIHRYESC